MAAAIGLAALAAHAQSLGDLARREAERRKAVKVPAKVYTNENILPALPVTPPSEEAAGPGAAAASTSAVQAERPPTPAERPRTIPARRSRTGGNASRPPGSSGTGTSCMEALQSRINGLWADFTARDDPAQRAVIAAERQRALDELERLKQEQANLEKQILDIEDDARRSGVPPGWIR